MPSQITEQMLKSQAINLDSWIDDGACIFNPASPPGFSGVPGENSTTGSAQKLVVFQTSGHNGEVRQFSYRGQLRRGACLPDGEQILSKFVARETVRELNGRKLILNRRIDYHGLPSVRFRFRSEPSNDCLQVEDSVITIRHLRSVLVELDLAAGQYRCLITSATAVFEAWVDMFGNVKGCSQQQSFAPERRERAVPPPLAVPVVDYIQAPS
jgi:hypothetical protein